MARSYRREDSRNDEHPVRWGTYSRISDDPDDEQRGVMRQDADTRTAVEALGHEVHKVYLENDTSAYRKKRIQRTDDLGNPYFVYRTVRPVWQEALGDLRSGVIDGLMVWDLDRLSRDPRDLEDAIEVVEHHGKTIASETGNIDLTTDGGRAMARVLMAMNNKSSADTGRRVARAARENAELGTAAGKRAFGWAEDKRALDPVESALARAGARDLILGSRTPSRIANEWNEAGAFTAHYAKPWRASTVRQYFRNPRLVGYRTYRREVLRTETGTPVMGAWEPLLDVATWEQLQVALGTETRADLSRVPHRNARHYLLTGLARCGICNALMYGNYEGRRDTYYYRCGEMRHGAGKHTLSIAGPATDAAISELARRRLERTDPVPVGPSEFPGAATMERLERKISELMQAFNGDQMPGSVVFPAVKELERDLDLVRAEHGVWRARQHTPRLEELAALFDSPETGVRRGALEQLLDAVLIRPPAPDARKYDLNRLDVVWKRDAQ